MKIISVANQKGGTGKSTAVQELATIIAKESRVLVIDFDQQCNTTKNARVDTNKPTIFDLFTDENPDIDEAIQKSPSGYDIIAGSPDMSKAEKQFTDTPDFELLLDLSEAVKNRYDYIFVDNGPSRNVLINMNYLAADYMILCIDAGEDSIDGIDAIVKDMMRYHSKGKDRSKTKFIGAIMSKYKKSKIGDAIVEITKNMFRDSIPKILMTEEEPFVMTVRNTVKVDEAKMMHQTLQEYATWSDVAADYRAIAKEIRRRING